MNRHAFREPEFTTENGLALRRRLTFDAGVRAPPPRWSLIFAIGGALGGLVGCAPIRAVSPGPVVARYSEALQAQDAAAVWALLDDEARAELGSLEAVEAYFAEAPEELDARGEQLRAVSPPTMSSRAEVRDSHDDVRDSVAGERDPVVLVLEDEAWRLVGLFLDTPALQTPVDAVRAFRHAAERRSLPGLLRVLSRDSRAALEADLDGLTAATADEFGIEIVVEGDSGLARLPDGAVLRLVRESGEWHVVGLDIGLGPTNTDATAR